MMKRDCNRRGISLIEIMAALIIAATIAAIGVRHLQKPNDTSRQRACDLTRETLQNYAGEYREANGQWPARDLSQLRSAEYAGSSLPVCPDTGDSYRIDRNGVVGCPTHERTR